MKILIPDDYQYATRELACLELLQGHEVTILGDLSKEPQAAALAEAEALVLIRERTQVTADFLRQMPQLQVISQTGKIARHVDLAACTAAGVLVVEGAGSPVAPAELTWALILAAQRKLVQAVVDMKEGKWQTNIGRALHGQTLGVWGYGKIGRMIAGFGRAFAMDVQIFGRAASIEAAQAEGYRICESREAFFATSDVLTVHLRLVKETLGIIKAGDLAGMKPDSLFVNTSRAELVEEGALETALQSGRPGFAALDVFPEEPVYDSDYALLRMANVICTPQVGYVEHRGYELYFARAFENLLSFFAGNPANVVNQEALKKGKR